MVDELLGNLEYAITGTDGKHQWQIGISNFRTSSADCHLGFD